MGQDTFDVGSGLAVPGLEATIEYGDATTVDRDRIPGAMLINDRSGQEWARVANFDGLHGDPDGRDTRDAKADQDGENAGIMRYGGRTIGLTGTVEAGSITAMRDIVTRLFSQFGKRERDLLVHPHNEVPVLVNHVLDPEPGEWVGSGGSKAMPTPSYWGGIANVAVDIGVSSAGTSGAAEIFSATGSVTGGTAAGDGSVIRLCPTDGTDGSLVEWSGEDVYIAALVGVSSGSHAPSSISVVLRDYDISQDLAVAATKTSPTIGQEMYWLSGRVDASSIARTTTNVGMAIKLNAASGDYTIVGTRAMLVLLDPDQPTPIGYFSGEVPGYEYDGRHRSSTSRGPTYAVNLILDPQMISGSWSGYLTAGIANPTVSLLSVGVTGSRSGRGVYFSGQKDPSGGATPAKLSLRPGVGGNQWAREALVSSGRSYRFSALIEIIQKPSDGMFLFVEWYGADSSLISTSSSSALVTPNPLDSSDYSVTHTFVAPTDAVKALVAFGNPATVEVGALLKIVVSDPCFIDVTDVDVGDFYGLGYAHDEVLQLGARSGRRQAPTSSALASQGARRRVPRPFLIKSVRKSSDGKAPEQQQDRRYRRDFTMSLRASDPRIYVLDERTSQIRLEGESKLVVRQAPSDFTLEGTGALATPTGYTSEGSYITVGGGSVPFRWSRDATKLSVTEPVQLPAGGVSVKAWSDSTGTFGNDPTQSLKTRFYRSAEAFTYASPRVVLGGAPNSLGFLDPASTFASRGMAYAANGSVGSRTFKYNDLTILLKRVNSTTWLELRWNSLSHAGGAYEFGTPEPSAPYAFELWCSHNTSGTLSTTKLASWDYTSTSDFYYPFRPLFDPMWLVSWMLNNVVYWELWNKYPSLIDPSGRIESGSYAIPSGLQSVVGTGVDGSPGWATRIATGSSLGDGIWDALAGLPPFVHYFEESNASSVPASQSIPVIGSVETPQVITLRGDIVDPIVQVTVPDFDDQSMTTSTARFSGTISDTDPIYVDLRDSSVRDRFGHNRRDLLVPGSRFEMLRPGINQVSLQAKSWGTYPSHMITSWRDALR